MKRIFAKLLASMILVMAFVLITVAMLDHDFEPFLFLLFTVADLALIIYVQRLIDRRFDKITDAKEYKAGTNSKQLHNPQNQDPSTKLLNSLCQMLFLNSNQRSSLSEFIIDFADIICHSENLSIDNIDIFIDRLYVTGAIMPDFQQYQRLGMNIVTTQRIYVPKAIQSLFPDWKELKDRADRAGLLLSSLKSAPSLDLWNTELSSFLPGAFFIEDVNKSPDSVLENIIRLAEEAISDGASLPEYIARITELPHRNETDILHEIDAQIEFYLRRFARELSITSEPSPTGFNEKIYRTINHINRGAEVHQWRTHNLHEVELEEMKQLAFSRKSS